MKDYTYQRISDAQYKKLVFQLRGQFNGLLNTFRCYGLDPLVDGAVDECVTLAENFAMAVRGKPKPIHIIDKPRDRATE